LGLEVGFDKGRREVDSRSPPYFKYGGGKRDSASGAKKSYNDIKPEKRLIGKTGKKRKGTVAGN